MVSEVLIDKDKLVQKGYIEKKSIALDDSIYYLSFLGYVFNKKRLFNIRVGRIL